MNIAIISLPYGRTPPVGYGGIERVVHILVEQLVKKGHQVTMFATPGSYCSGKTIEVSGYDPSRAPSGVHKKADFLSEEPLYEAVQNYLKSHPVDIIHDWSFQNLFVLRHQDEFPFLISTCVPSHPHDTVAPILLPAVKHTQPCTRRVPGTCTTAWIWISGAGNIVKRTISFIFQKSRTTRPSILPCWQPEGLVHS